MSVLQKFLSKFRRTKTEPVEEVILHPAWEKDLFFGVGDVVAPCRMGPFDEPVTMHVYAEPEEPKEERTLVIGDHIDIIETPGTHCLVLDIQPSIIAVDKLDIQIMYNEKTGWVRSKAQWIRSDFRKIC